jgi:hypothetical protein
MYLCFQVSFLAVIGPGPRRGRVGRCPQRGLHGPRSPDVPPALVWTVTASGPTGRRHIVARSNTPARRRGRQIEPCPWNSVVIARALRQEATTQPRCFCLCPSKARKRLRRIRRKNPKLHCRRQLIAVGAGPYLCFLFVQLFKSGGCPELLEGGKGREGV